MEINGPDHEPTQVSASSEMTGGVPAPTAGSPVPVPVSPRSRLAEPAEPAALEAAPPSDAGGSLRLRLGLVVSLVLKLAVVLLAVACAAAGLWGFGMMRKYEQAEKDRREAAGVALGAISVEFRVAHYSLQSFVEAQDPTVLADARSALGPAVRVASRVLTSVGDLPREDTGASLPELLGSAATRLGRCIDLMSERTKYYGKLQDLDKRVLQKVMPRLLSLADAMAPQPGSARTETPVASLTAAERQTAVNAATEVGAIADSYLELGVMPEEKPPARVSQVAAVDAARRYLTLRTSQDYALKSAQEKYSKWLGVHYWEISFAEGSKTLVAYIDAQTGKFAGYMRPDYTIIHKGEMPSLTRGEALVKARTLLSNLPDVPQDIAVGPVEFKGTWQITFWPKIGGIVYYSHPVTVWVDAKSNEAYGYQSLRLPVKPLGGPAIDASYATYLGKKAAEKGFMKEAFKAYRGSTYLAVYRSDLTAEDTLVWAVEFVISSRYHETTGYDMAIILINTRDGRYEGYKGLGDGPWRVDWWQMK